MSASAPPRRITILLALLLAAFTFAADEPPRIVDGHKRELANVASVFIVTNDEACRSEFCAHVETQLPDLELLTSTDEADAVLVLTASLEHEVIPLVVDPGGCKPCQAQSTAPQRLDIEKRKVVLSVLVPTGPNEYRRIFFTSASGAFGSNPDERVAIQFEKAWRKWNREKK